ncbi:MAG: hypothetical protein ACJAWW_001503 [Sulfurimonas sp.]|jgi:hypothetical protein
MVNFIKRDKDDLYAKPIIGFLLKNQKFLMTLKIVVLALFLYAIYFGFTNTGKDNNFTWAVFWGIFWSLFMVVTLPTLGRVFCGICPHGFMGKYITKFGLKKTMPKWMQNRFIGLLLLVIGWWGVYYMFPNLFRTALGTAVMFSVMTLLSFVVYFLYKDMSYCKYICPIGTLTRAYSKLSFTWLGTYKSACNECKTFECATACPHNLKPFTFDKKSSMTDCTLCMDCSAACEAISFKVTKPSFSLFSKFQVLKAEIWAYVLILGAISITMGFHHGIGRSNAAQDMIWSKTAEFFKGYIDFGSIDAIGLFAFLYAMLFTISASLLGMFIASKILKKDFSKIFYDLGYSYAPLFILGSIAHSLETFFIKGYERIVEGFAQGFGFAVDVASLSNRGDSWLHVFGLLKWIGIVWAFVILYKRMKLLDANKIRKIIAFPFAAFLILFFLGTNLYTGYIFSTYGSKSGGHANHGAKAKASHGDSRHKVNALKPTASDTVYFSKTNPAAKKRKSYGGGSSHSGGRNRIPSQKVWPIFEDSSAKKNCMNSIDAQLYVLDANLKTIKLTESKKRGCKSVSFKMPHNGYYNLFYSSKMMQNNTLYVKTAKYEKLRFNHSTDAIYDEQRMAAHSIKEVPFDILRLRENDETFYHRLYSGDKIRLKVLLNYKAIQNASLTLSTKSGWSKSVKTDKDGIAVFTLVKDYFPEWNKFDKRHKSNFLLTANYTQEANGIYDDKEYDSINYEATYASTYYPEKSGYKSYAFGLFTAILSGFSIYWFRKRREKPFKEVSFNEKD